MKIAVGTWDGTNLCEHLARSSAFHVFDVEDGKIASRTFRDWRREGCGDHQSFVEILAGCDVVLCGGIGQGAVTALTAHGIKPVVAAGKHSADEAIALYLSGKLATTAETVCLCSDH